MSTEDIRDAIATCNVTKLRSVLVRAAPGAINHVEGAQGGWLHVVLTDAARRAMLGNTAVAGATVHALAESLLEAGIDATLQNAQRQTALDVARAINLPHKAPIVAALELAATQSGLTPRSGAETDYAKQKTRISLADPAAAAAGTATSSSSTAAHHHHHHHHHHRNASSAAADAVDQVVADAAEAADEALNDKPRKRVSLQQHDVSATVQKRSSGHKKLPGATADDQQQPPPLPPMVDTRARSKSTSLGAGRRQQQRAASQQSFAGPKTSDLKRGDRIVPGIEFKLNFAALDSRSPSGTQLNSPTDDDGPRRAQTARVIPSLSNMPVPILRSPREAQPPLTQGLGALISPRSLKKLRDKEQRENERANNDNNNNDGDGDSDGNAAAGAASASDVPPPLPPLSVSASGSPEVTRREKHKKREGKSAPASPRSHHHKPAS